MDDKDALDPREDQAGEPGAEGGTGGDQDTVPGAPGNDDSAAGDTDQHSSADA